MSESAKRKEGGDASGGRRTPADGKAPAVRLARLPVDKPAAAVAFLHTRGGGVMDLIAHFWERLAATPPLARGDLHLVVAAPQDSESSTHIHISVSDIEVAGLTGAMLYVPKAHRADVLALDPPTAEAFAAYIAHRGPNENHPDKIPTPATTTNDPGSTATPILLHDFTAAPATVEVPVLADGPSPSPVPIDFLTGGADGIEWLAPGLLRALHRKSPARQLINVVMQLPESIGCETSAAVRSARDSDLSLLNRWRRAYKEERGILFDADLDAWVATGRIFVFEIDAPAAGSPLPSPLTPTVVAVAKLDLELPGLVEIGGVYTFPEHRQRGYGSRLVSDLACRIRAMGKVPTLQVDESNQPAVKLYQGAGWEQRGRLARVWLTG